MQRAIMCAIMSEQQDLHVYVKTKDLDTFFDSESVKCFDKNYALKLTLLYPKTQPKPPSKPNLYCRGGFRALKYGVATMGRLLDQQGVEVVLCSKRDIEEEAFHYNTSLMEVLFTSDIKKIGKRAFSGCTALNEVGGSSWTRCFPSQGICL